jgi:hypothetical protein
VKKNTNPDYLNEQYFEDWGASPQLTDKAHRAEEEIPVPSNDEDCPSGPFDGPENCSCGDY